MWVKRIIKRFTEHTPHKSISKNIGSLDNIKSNYARHLIDNNHSYRSFNTNFIPLHFCDKGLGMNALEEFEIYRGHNNPVYKNNILNDKLNFKSNPLYDTAILALAKTKR